MKTHDWPTLKSVATETEGSYLLPIRGDHRTDWGQAFVEELDRRLQELRPSQLDQAQTSVHPHGDGSLIVRLVHASQPEEVVVDIHEDAARVFCGPGWCDFALASGPDPAGWIPDAVSLVLHLLRGEVLVQATLHGDRVVGHFVYLDTGDTAREPLAGEEAGPDPRSARDTLDREISWRSPSFL